jgi:hypothetical protein
MIASKCLLYRHCPPIPISGRGICTTDMRCRRQDLNVGQQSLIRGSSRMTSFLWGCLSYALSRAFVARHCDRVGAGDAPLIPMQAMVFTEPICARRSPAMAAVRVARRRGGNNGLAQRIPPLTHNGATLQDRETHRSARCSNLPYYHRAGSS